MLALRCADCNAIAMQCNAICKSVRVNVCMYVYVFADHRLWVTWQWYGPGPVTAVVKMMAFSILYKYMCLCVCVWMCRKFATIVSVAECVATTRNADPSSSDIRRWLKWRNVHKCYYCLSVVSRNVRATFHAQFDDAFYISAGQDLRVKRKRNFYYRIFFILQYAFINVHQCLANERNHSRKVASGSVSKTILELHFSLL